MAHLNMENIRAFQDEVRKRDAERETFYNVQEKPPIEVDKECSCCKKRNITTTRYIFNKQGMWWNCTCGSTLIDTRRKAA